MKKPENNTSESNNSWSEQKSRMDDMLAKLKNEIQEVKSMDKDLTRQFINLGGLINKIKTDQLDEEDFQLIDNVIDNTEEDVVNDDTKP